jgi:hypothetical protein
MLSLHFVPASEGSAYGNCAAAAASRVVTLTRRPPDVNAVFSVVTFGYRYFLILFNFIVGTALIHCTTQ